MDEVVAAVQYERDVFIFMRSGTVWRMFRDSSTGKLLFQKMHELVPR